MNLPPVFWAAGTLYVLSPNAATANKALAITSDGTAWEMRDVSNASLLTSGTLPTARMPNPTVVGTTGGAGFPAADAVLDAYAPNKFIYLDSDAAGVWGLKFRGFTTTFVDIFGLTGNGTTGEVRIGAFFSSFFPTFYSGNAERMRISTAGGVSIGTTTDPGTANLLVAGNVTCSTELVVGLSSGGLNGAGCIDVLGAGSSLNIYKRGVTAISDQTTAGNRWAFYAAADGFHFWTGTTLDTNVISPAGDWTLNFNLTVTKSTTMLPTATPANPASSAEARLYVKGGKLICQYNDAGTVRYKYLDLTGTGVTWVAATVAP